MYKLPMMRLELADGIIEITKAIAKTDDAQVRVFLEGARVQMHKASSALNQAHTEAEIAEKIRRVKSSG